MSNSEDGNSSSFWTNPAVLMAIAGIITAIATLVVALAPEGLIGGDNTTTTTTTTSTTASPTASSATTTTVPPTATPTQPAGMAVDSWPTGAEVFAMPAAGSIFDVDVDAVTAPGNLLGTTPLREDIGPGPYFVAVSYTADQLTELGYDLPGPNDPTYDDAFPSDLSRVSAVSFGPGEVISAITKVYELTVDNEDGAKLVSLALPLPVEERGRPTPYIYPTPATVEPLSDSYDFPEDVMTRAIQDNVVELGLTGIVDDTLVDDMVAVLRKTGKVRLFTETEDIIVELGDGTFAVMVFG